jgi:hypothetical protein
MAAAIPRSRRRDRAIAQPPLLVAAPVKKESAMCDLIRTLSEGRHHVELSLRPTKSVQAFKECIDRGYVHIKFTDTRGGTELTVPLDRQRSELSRADFDSGIGTVVIAGRLSLDFTLVECIAEIDLSTLSGTGHVETLSQSDGAAVTTPDM